MKMRAAIDKESFDQLQERRESLTRVAPFPYSEDLRSVMDPEVFTSSPHATVRDVVRTMSKRGVSSVIVVDEKDYPVGILTERDVLDRIVAEDCINLISTPVSAVMTKNPLVLSPDNTIYRALSILSAKRVKHLPLVENGKVEGIVTFRQLLKLKHPEPMTFIEEIRGASDIRTLRAIRSKLPGMVASRLDGGIRAYDLVVMLSLLNQDCHVKTLELLIEEIGEPPSPICVFVSGSHGRRENLLTPDQDHGMIIADSDNGEVQYDPYYIELSTRFSEALAEIGFVKCPGYIMSMNPIWRKSLREWRLQIQYWFDLQVRELGRFVTVLYDSAPIYGNNAYFAEMMDSAFSLLAKHHEVLRVLHEEEGAHKVPTGLLGRFITERKGSHRGEIDIKRSGLIFVVEGIRILALLHKVKATSTLKRIEFLVSGGFIHPDDGEYFETAYLILLHLTLSAQVEKMKASLPIDTYIAPEKLSRQDRETLRHAFKAVSSLQSLVATEFGELVL